MGPAGLWSVVEFFFFLKVRNPRFDTHDLWTRAHILHRAVLYAITTTTASPWGRVGRTACILSRIYYYNNIRTCMWQL